jgi:RNA 2',3'-cyclic 3'-phosphodiesterase
VADGEPGGRRKLRAFVALEVPEPQRGRLAGHLDRCRAAAPAFRWVTPESLHITLRFLGSVSPDLLDRLQSGLRQLRGRPFGLALDGVGTFGTRSAPRVIWVGVREGAERASELAAEVETVSQAAGLEPEARPFRGHVTLARARGDRGGPLPELPSLPPLQGWTATEFVLYESRLERPTAVYLPLERFRLDWGP